jgi:hypothetical protein
MSTHANESLQPNDLRAAATIVALTVAAFAGDEMMHNPPEETRLRRLLPNRARRLRRQGRPHFKNERNGVAASESAILGNQNSHIAFGLGGLLPGIPQRLDDAA